jgi:hypothetical protein
MDYIGLGMIALGLAWAAGFGWAHFRAVGKARAAESWPTAMGKVHSCQVVEEESTDREGHTTTWYNPVVAYSYSAGGREHEGRRLRFGSYRKSTRKKAEAMLAAYAPGGTAAVRYNPDRPEECVLETVRPGPIYLIMALFGFLFVAMGLFWERMAG